MTAPPFTVWAPKAKRVEVELTSSGTRLPLEAGPDGHFTLKQGEITGAYQLHLDGGGPLPDPRAHDLESVHGPAHPIDHSRFVWSDGAFTPVPLEQAIIYELHVGTFTPDGTFDSAIRRLPELKALGITHVEPLPIATFPGSRGWGYDGVGLFAPQRSYGGVDGLKRFVDACHQEGLAVLLDVVLNHLGPIGNYLGQFGPYFRSDRHTPWGDAINYDGRDSGPVRRHFLDCALHWLEHYHADGLRLDAVHSIHDDSALPLLEQLSCEVDALSKRLGRSMVLIAESDLNNPATIRPRHHHGQGMDAQWSDDFHHALHVTLTGEDRFYYQDFKPKALTQLGRVLSEGWLRVGQPNAFLRCHHGRPFEGSLWQLLGYAQTHDQIGNRPLGERLTHLVGEGKAKIAMALVMTAPFTPMLFQGEEWAASAPFLYFVNHPDEALNKLIFESRQKELAEFGVAADQALDPSAESTFRQCVLDWSERESGLHGRMLAFTQALVSIRREHLLGDRAHRPRTYVDQEAMTLRMDRGELTVLVNLGPPTDVQLPLSTWRPLLTSGPAVHCDGKSVQLPTDSVWVGTQR